jgi:DNA-damage-inducible protein J
MKTTTINVRIESSLKDDVEVILAKLGLTTSETIQLFYSQIKLHRGMPFSVELPNDLTAKTLRESRAGKGVRKFTSKKDLYADLGLREASAATLISSKLGADLQHGRR